MHCASCLEFVDHETSTIKLLVCHKACFNGFDQHLFNNSGMDVGQMLQEKIERSVEMVKVFKWTFIAQSLKSKASIGIFQQ